MALTDDQKIRARELKAEGMSNRSIAEAIGSNKDAVARYLRSLGPLAPNVSQTCAKKPPARTRASKGGGAEKCAKVAQTGAESAPSSDMPDRQRMAAMAYEDVQTMRSVALRGLTAVANVDDVKERTWMESSYLKLLKESTKLLGSWGGLDEMTEGENPALADYAESLLKKENESPCETWEAKP